MMNRSFNYPVNLQEAEEGGYIVTFPDFPEAITQGESKEEALIEATDCLEEAVANRMVMKLDIPQPTPPKNDQSIVSLHIELAAKAALYIYLREAKLNNTVFAKKLDCDEKEIRRLIDPHYSSKLPRIEHALEKLGLRFSVEVTS